MRGERGYYANPCSQSGLFFPSGLAAVATNSWVPHDLQHGWPAWRVPPDAMSMQICEETQYDAARLRAAAPGAQRNKVFV